MLYICSRCMKSVSELSLWVLSSRAFPFFVVPTTALKNTLVCYWDKGTSLAIFSAASQRQKASLSSENAALVHCLFAVPEGQQWITCVQLSMPAFEKHGIQLSNRNKQDAFQHIHAHVWPIHLEKLVCLAGGAGLGDPSSQRKGRWNSDAELILYEQCT